jgi:hypothetical protein
MAICAAYADGPAALRAQAAALDKLENSGLDDDARRICREFAIQSISLGLLRNPETGRTDDPLRHYMEDFGREAALPPAREAVG